MEKNKFSFHNNVFLYVEGKGTKSELGDYREISRNSQEKNFKGIPVCVWVNSGLCVNMSTHGLSYSLRKKNLPLRI